MPLSLSRGPSLSGPPGTESSGVAAGGLGFAPDRTGCEIMSVHACRDETEDQYVSLSDLILFRLMAPPLQPGEMESYLIWGV
jgi:hypothetical protein